VWDRGQDFPTPLKVFVVAEEDPRSELARLLKQQHKTRQDEVYGGLSHDERADYYGQSRAH